jgi:N-methylhydantoinase A
MSDPSAVLGSAGPARAVPPGPAEDAVRYTIDIDTGGTFTDGYVAGPHGAIQVKTDTTPHNFAVGVLECVRSAADRLDITVPDLLFETGIIRLSSTVCTNALLNRDGARVGALLGETLYRDHGSRLSPQMPLERAMIELVPDDPGDEHLAVIDAAVRRLLERGARIIVVALSGPGLGARESQVRDLIARTYPRHYLGAVPILRSSLVTMASDPAVRVHTAVINAYVHPVMSRFLYQLEDQLKVLGYRSPLLSANADHGTSRVAKTTAIRTWGSGPAAGVAAARTLAQSLGLRHVVALDIGGTSSDITLLNDFAEPRTVRPLIHGIEVSLPTVNILSLGVGGGSVATVADGGVTVGPESMGALPGPASFGLGGQEATLTDAFCCLGVFDAGNFSGGRKRLDVAAAREVVRSRVADPLGVDIDEAAVLVVDAAVEEINRTVRRVIAQSGLPPEEFALFAFGGNGGILAHRIAERLGVRQAFMFPLSPVFSAFGMSGLNLVHAYEAVADAGDLEETIRELKLRGERDMSGEGVDIAALSFQVEAETSHPDGSVSVAELDDAAPVAGPAGGSVLIRLRAISPVRGAGLPAAGGGGSAGTGKRDIRWAPGLVTADVFDWDTVAPGDVITGPALLENELTTALVPPGARVRIGASAEAMFSFADEELETGQQAASGGRAT